ncbi:hypothetical protein JCM6882_001833 [Rhodosporidiobolus microsporus]
MLDRLPPELLDHILELAVPPASTLNEAKPREETLRQCSLVSQAVRERAQALLWRDVVVRIPAQAARLLQLVKEGDVGDLRRATKSVQWLFKAPPRYDQIEEVVQLSSGLQHLELVFSSVPVAVEQFGAKTVASLTTLSLWNASLLPEPTTFLPFPRLSTLEFEGVYMCPAAMSKLLTPTALPSLRALFLGQFDQDGDPVFPKLAPAFVSRLEDFQLTFSPGLAPPIPPSTFEFAPPAALIVEISDLESLLEHIAADPDFTLPPHLFFDTFYGVRTTDNGPRFSILTSVVLAYPTPLQSIHLPISLLLSQAFHVYLEDLLSLCDKRSIDVVWRQEEQAFCMSFSQTFRRYARRLKATGGR